jgi:hypothetical protein
MSARKKCVIQNVITLEKHTFYGINLFAYLAHFVFLRDVWIRTQRAAAPYSKQARYQLSYPSPKRLNFTHEDTRLNRTASSLNHAEPNSS